VTVPETRPKHQKAGPSRRISGKKLRDGIQTQEAEGEKGPSRSFEGVFVRDGARNATKTPENGTVTQNFGQKVA